MKLVICSIFDAKAEAWTNPMFFQSAGQAMRSFVDAVNEKNTDFNKHPEDYTLFLLGSFDQRSGNIEVRDAPVALAKGINLVESD